MATAPLPPSSPAPAGRIPATRASPAGEWLFGHYRLEPATRRLYSEDRVRELDARAMAVLECLLRRAGNVVPRATLIAEAWPEADTVFDSAVSKVMRRLRTALGDRGGHVLQTIYGEGYRLALPAVLLPPAPDGAAALAQPRVGNGRGVNGAGAGSSADAPSGPSPIAAAPGTEPPPRPRPGRGPWMARLPWIIALAATLVAAALAWLLLHPAAGG